MLMKQHEVSAHFTDANVSNLSLIFVWIQLNYHKFTYIIYTSNTCSSDNNLH